MAVTEITMPMRLLDVSPPTRSTSYRSQQRRMPAYSSSKASTEKRLLTATLTSTCRGVAFIAQMSLRFTATAL